MHRLAVDIERKTGRGRVGVLVRKWVQAHNLQNYFRILHVFFVVDKRCLLKLLCLSYLSENQHAVIFGTLPQSVWHSNFQNLQLDEVRLNSNVDYLGARAIPLNNATFKTVTKLVCLTSDDNIGIN